MTLCDRRTILRSGALGALTLGAKALPSRAVSGVSPRVERIVIVALAGGVRTRETLGTPSNVPNLMRLAEHGVLFPRTRASNLGHFGATLSIFTGISESRGIRDNARGTDPTLFEYLRKDLGLKASEVWISTSGGAQEANLAYSLHPDYGSRFGAGTLDGDGIFNTEFNALLGTYGKPRDLGIKEQALFERMRGSIGGAEQEALASVDSVERVESFLLEELRRGTQDIKGIGAADAKAFRVARNLLAVFRPRILAVVLRDADVAHGNFNNYVQVIRRNDEMLGELWGCVQADPELASTTAMFVLPEFGRDADLNSRRGLDHGDGSEDLNYVSLLCLGPGFRRGEVAREEVSTIDVCATVCALAGADARYARGKRLPRLFG